MITLFYNYYTQADMNRQAELDFCLRQNLSNPQLDVVVLVDPSQVLVTSGVKKPKVVKFNGRPTYRDIFNLSRSMNPSGISAFCNADIYIPEPSVKQIVKAMRPGVCLALSRWDMAKDGTLRLFDRADSQDTWVWQGEVAEHVHADFGLGRPGCDNRIAHELGKQFTVLNPSRSIKTVHVHMTELRTYTRADVVPGPYYFPQPQ